MGWLMFLRGFTMVADKGALPAPQPLKAQCPRRDRGLMHQANERSVCVHCAAKVSIVEGLEALGERQRYHLEYYRRLRKAGRLPS